MIDLSFNQGGYDPAAMMFASRFADKRRKTMLRLSAGQNDSEAKGIYVSPRGPHQYTKPVYVMTSNATVSAGEALTLMLKAFPHVTHLGEPTRGCLSSFLNKWMPRAICAIDFHPRYWPLLIHKE